MVLRETYAKLEIKPNLINSSTNVVNEREINLLI